MKIIVEIPNLNEDDFDRLAILIEDVVMDNTLAEEVNVILDEDGGFWS